VSDWIYCSNFGQDGHITSPKHPERSPIPVRGADFRFRLDRDVAEATSGSAQFSWTFDVWGDRFITHSTMHVRHVVLPRQYLARAPLLDTGAAAVEISDRGRPSGRMYPISQPQAWRVERTRIRQERYHENKLENVVTLPAAAAGPSTPAINFLKNTAAICLLET
jgi:hypothetical protein